MPIEKVPHLLAATRTDITVDFLKAWLDYHLQVASKALVLVDRRPHEDPGAVFELLESYGDDVVVKERVSRAFNNEKGAAVLRRGIKELMEAGFETMLHCDKDEFVEKLPEVPDLARAIKDRKFDAVMGRMIDRMAPGCVPFDSDCASRDEFCRLAPVRSVVMAAIGHPNTKVWLTRVPHVFFHKAPRGVRVCRKWRGLDHFRWTTDLMERWVRKNRNRGDPWIGKRKRRELKFLNGGRGFQNLVAKHQWSYSHKLRGWFNYGDLYGKILDWIPEDGLFVEVGVYAGKSLGWMAERAQLYGKKLRLVGVDLFDDLNFRHPNPHRPLGWKEGVAAHLESCCPFLDVELIQGDSAESAENFPEGSLDAAFIDAGHSEARVGLDLEAWWPKIREGGLLAGHDLCRAWPGVGRALKKSGIPYKRISKSSWIAWKGEAGFS